MLVSSHVFLIDDDLSVNRAVGNLLESAGHHVSAFLSAEEFLSGESATDGDCLVLDLCLPGINGLALQQTLLERGVILPIVFITGQGKLADGVQAMKQGAVNFLLKPFSDQALLGAVDEAVAAARELRRQRLDLYQAEQRIAALTQREREVMGWVVSGLRNRDIAERLGVAVQTIKVHRGKVMEKTEVGSLCELVRLVDRVRAGDPPAVA